MNVLIKYNSNLLMDNVSFFFQGASKRFVKTYEVVKHTITVTYCLKNQGRNLRFRYIHRVPTSSLKSNCFLTLIKSF